MSKLFVRERGSVTKGDCRPRFALVAVQGTDLKVFHSHLRKVEIEKIAADIGAEIVYLPRGEKAGQQENPDCHDRGHRRRRERDEG